MNAIATGLLLSQFKLKKNILTTAVLFTGIVSIVIAILSYFGLNMGTFVISLDDSAYRTGISLSTDKEFKASYPNLLVKPMKNASPVTYRILEIDEAIEADGDYVDSQGYSYIAYSFYLRNESDGAVDLNFNINITRTSNEVDSAIRIMVIEDKDKKTVFLKDDGGPIYVEDTSEDAKIPEEYLKFFTNESVCQTEIANFRPFDIKKFTILVWLEGYDAQCDERIKSGRLRLNFDFSIIGATKAEDE